MIVRLLDRSTDEIRVYFHVASITYFAETFSKFYVMAFDNRSSPRAFEASRYWFFSIADDYDSELYGDELDDDDFDGGDSM